MCWLHVEWMVSNFRSKLYEICVKSIWQNEKNDWVMILKSTNLQMIIASSGWTTKTKAPVEMKHEMGKKKRQTRKKNNLYWQTFNNAGNKYFEHTFILNIKIIVNCYKYHSLVDNSALHSYPLIKRKEGLTYS